MSSEFSFNVSWEIMEEDEIDLSDEVTVHVTVQADVPEGWRADNVQLLIDMEPLYSSDDEGWDSAGDERSGRIGFYSSAENVDSGLKAEAFETVHVDEYLDDFVIAGGGQEPLKYDIGDFEDSTTTITKVFVLAVGRSIDKAPASRGHYQFRCSVEYVPVPPPSARTDCDPLEFEIGGH